MSSSLRCALLLVLLVACSAGHSMSEVVSKFVAFKTEFKRKYQSEQEEAQAMKCFAETLRQIDRLNAEDKGAQYGINHFSDICPDEFARRYLTATTKPTIEDDGQPFEMPALVNVTSWDWRNQSAVTAVKNQGQCGSCWAFAAVAVLEGAWRVAGKPLTGLSEGELVQCANLTLTNGCQGGNVYWALAWIRANGGINRQTAYPYTSWNGVKGTCNETLAAVNVATFTRITLYSKRADADLSSILKQQGPLAVSVNSTSWQSYKSGIKTLCSNPDSNGLNHAVTLVGFTPTYWIVKNSWGTSWGEAGYIRLARGVNCDGVSVMAYGVIV